MLKYLSHSLDNKQDQQKYGDIILDFIYFKTSDEFERRIEKNPVIIATLSKASVHNVIK